MSRSAASLLLVFACGLVLAQCQGLVQGQDFRQIAASQGPALQQEADRGHLAGHGDEAACRLFDQSSHGESLQLAQAQMLDLELRGDLVRAVNLTSGQNLPRIAPARLGATLAWTTWATHWPTRRPRS